jgi:hypothetical protein
MTTSLGGCCICRTYVGVSTIVMLSRRAPVPGTGWGCAVCGLPSDGAVAVLCDGCMEFVEAGALPVYVCEGYAGEDRRALHSSLSPEPFEHDDEAHRREEAS